MPEPVFEADVAVVARRVESDGVVSLELGGADLPAWDPGAHIDVVLPGGLVRQYSLCGEDGRWRIAVLREPDSRGGSAWIHDHAHPGTTLRIRGPRNNFPLLPAPRYLFVAGGVGITPILPMVAAAEAAGADWTLHYGGRSRTSMAFVKDLESYGERVAVTPEDEAGMLDLDVILAPPRESTVVYCCGPAGLIDAVETRCQAWPPGSLHVERFTAVEHGGEAHEFEVELRASGMTVAVPAELSILEAVENAGVRVISSCTEGICGSCETTVLDGEIDHRDSVLDDDERDAGDVMMICVSRAKGARLVLDL